VAQGPARFVSVTGRMTSTSCPHEIFAAGSNGAIQSAANTAAPNQIPTVLLGQAHCYGEYTAVIIRRDGQIQFGAELETCASTVFSAKNSASK
jgi:hypothetical protein